MHVHAAARVERGRRCSTEKVESMGKQISSLGGLIRDALQHLTGREPPTAAAEAAAASAAAAHAASTATAERLQQVGANATRKLGYCSRPRAGCGRGGAPGNSHRALCDLERARRGQRHVSVCDAVRGLAVRSYSTIARRDSIALLASKVGTRAAAAAALGARLPAHAGPGPAPAGRTRSSARGERALAGAARVVSSQPASTEQPLGDEADGPARACPDEPAWTVDGAAFPAARMRIVNRSLCLHRRL
jgi:hypothetical protein